MKKWIIILSLIIVATITYNTFSIESEYYVKSVPVYKIYHHAKGYVVLYEKQNGDIHRIFLPYTWFQVPQDSGTTWKAEIFYGKNSEYPYINIYWDKEGFSHIRVFAKEKRTDPSWGILNSPNKFDDSFDIDSPDLQF